jgi:hypothetical protein
LTQQLTFFILWLSAFSLQSSIEKLKWEVALFTFLHRQKDNKKNGQKQSLRVFLVTHTPQFKPYMRCKTQSPIILILSSEDAFCKTKSH